jgi:hypothetical protein
MTVVASPYARLPDRSEKEELWIVKVDWRSKKAPYVSTDFMFLTIVRVKVIVLIRLVRMPPSSVAEQSCTFESITEKVDNAIMTNAPPDPDVLFQNSEKLTVPTLWSDRKNEPPLDPV